MCQCVVERAPVTFKLRTKRIKGSGIVESLVQSNVTDKLSVKFNSIHRKMCNLYDLFFSNYLEARCHVNDLERHWCIHK